MSSYTMREIMAMERREDEQRQFNADEFERHHATVQRTLHEADVGDVAHEIGDQLLALIRSKQDPAVIGQALIVGLGAYVDRIAAHRADQDPNEHPSPDDAVRMYLLPQSVAK